MLWKQSCFFARFHLQAKQFSFFNYYKDGFVWACDEMCRRNSFMRSNGDTWWWDEEVDKTISRKKDAHRAMCWNNAEENRNWYKSRKINA